ncbi:hypothetical protein [Nocardioides fonticola]
MPAAPGSLLADLRARRDAALAKLYLDLPVRRLPGVVVRFRPVTSAELLRAVEAFGGSEDPDAQVNHDATLLAMGCVAVWTRPDGDDSSEPPANAPTFADGVAEALGITAKTGAEAVRGLYLTDGDVSAAAKRLQVWSGFTIAEADEVFQGN